MNDYYENFNLEECGLFCSEFSLIFEWKYILVVGNVVGMSICDLFVSNFDYKVCNGVLNVFDVDFDIFNFGVFL